MKKLMLCLAGVFVLASVSYAKEVEIKKCATPPVIDGKLDDACWKATSKQELESNVMGEDLFEKAFAYITYDDAFLYIGVECYDTMMKEIKASAKSGGDVWADDCVEIFIDPTNNGVSYFHILANSAGLYDKGFYKKRGSIGGWKTKKTAIKSTKEEDKWIVEFAIPMDEMAAGIKKELDKTSWRLNIERERPSKSNAPYEDYIWSPTWGSSHMPDRFGVIKFK